MAGGPGAARLPIRRRRAYRRRGAPGGAVGSRPPEGRHRARPAGDRRRRRPSSSPSRSPAHPELDLAGTFSHLAVPGEDDAYTDMQLLRFARALDGMRSAGVDPGIVHVERQRRHPGRRGQPSRTRSGRAWRCTAWCRPASPTATRACDPALTLKALPLRIFDLPAGEAIGYGLRFRAARATRIATLGIGYGDGWPRSHINNGWALVRGRTGTDGRGGEHGRHHRRRGRGARCNLRRRIRPDRRADRCPHHRRPGRSRAANHQLRGDDRAPATGFPACTSGSGRSASAPHQPG